MPKQLGEIVHDYRKKHQMSLREFSARSGVGKSYLSIIERGRPDSGKFPEPSIDTVRAIADAMAVDHITMFRKLGMQVEVEKPNAPTEVPFRHIPLTKDELNAALAEGRLLILPFRVPRTGDFVYIPTLDYGGMVITLTVVTVMGGVYEAEHEAVGKIKFTLFDIDRTVFASRQTAHTRLAEMKAELRKTE